ncbi:SMP-30/gluconolactonase/LRE family protein [Coraliomargarita parva]|uniref:SMP-30/gluconolactonase/LRE family protein n=1 Tax=Coraliomargarita parva TaxID=3014050 RepID=UPI0022B4F8BA|nr:SMP-30/gluconolactonase/LRE family protein [Coraliomargarita parva]
MSTFRTLLALYPLCSLLHSQPTIESIATGFRFTEGPALNAEGELYFTDIPDRKIYQWNETEGIRVFREASGKANGLMFDPSGQLHACEGESRVLSYYDTDGHRHVLADSYNNHPFNSPNDLWIDPKGGIYFTDPRYGRRDNLEQDGEHVYYLKPDRSEVIRVIDDMIRPNGLIGTSDGKYLYVADHGGKQTFRYTIRDDGHLEQKQLFAAQASDGMSIDSKNRIYLTDAKIDIYEADGSLWQSVELPERPANVLVASEDPLSLYVTARSSVYRISLPDTNDN